MPDKREKGILVCGESELGYSRDETMIEALRSLDGWRLIDCRDTGSAWGSRLLAQPDGKALRRRIKKRLLRFRIWRLIATRSVACILVMKNNPGLLFTIAPWAKEAGIPILYDLWVSRTLMAERDGGDVAAALAHESRIMAAADVGIAMSDPYRRFYVESLRCPEERIVRVPLAVSGDWLSCPAALCASDGMFIAGYWGGFLKQHGIDILLEAARILRSQPDIQFRFFGAGRDYDVKAKLAQAGPNVNYFGLVPSRTALIASVDACHVGMGHLRHIHDAHLTLPNKALEGMARGKAIIHVDDPNFYSQYGTPASASESVLFYREGAQELAKAIMDLKNNPSRRREIGQNAIRAVREYHTVRAVRVALSGILSNVKQQQTHESFPRGINV